MQSNANFKIPQTVIDTLSGVKPLVFSAKSKVLDILKDMRKLKRGASSIVDHQKHLIGMVTEKEIMYRVFSGPMDWVEGLDGIIENSPEKLSAWDVMISNPKVLNPYDDIDDALELMKSYGYRYMPVITNNQKVAGIVDYYDLYEHVEAKTRDMIDFKDSLISYFGYPELYGGAGGYKLPCR